MPRDPRAYLSDVIDACDAIGVALENVDLEGYRQSRLIRSAVEREFITIGEAVSALSSAAPHLFNRISDARRIVDFRNQLTHEYLGVDDEIVWAIANRERLALCTECTTLLDELGKENG